MSSLTLRKQLSERWERTANEAYQWPGAIQEWLERSDVGDLPGSITASNLCQRFMRSPVRLAGSSEEVRITAPHGFWTREQHLQKWEGLVNGVVTDLTDPRGRHVWFCGPHHPLGLDSADDLKVPFFDLAQQGKIWGLWTVSKFPTHPWRTLACTLAEPERGYCRIERITIKDYRTEDFLKYMSDQGYQPWQVMESLLCTFEELTLRRAQRAAEAAVQLRESRLFLREHAPH